MAEITIIIRDHATPYVRDLSRKLAIGLRGGIEDSMTHILRIMVTYPPPRPNQRYIRTGIVAEICIDQVDGT